MATSRGCIIDGQKVWEWIGDGRGCRCCRREDAQEVVECWCSRSNDKLNKYDWRKMTNTEIWLEWVGQTRKQDVVWVVENYVQLLLF